MFGKLGKGLEKKLKLRGVEEKVLGLIRQVGRFLLGLVGC